LMPVDPRVFQRRSQLLDSPVGSFELDSLSGGMNTKVHPTRIGPDEAALIQNFFIKQGAFAEKRAGTIDKSGTEVTDTVSGVVDRPTGKTYAMGQYYPSSGAVGNEMLMNVGEEFLSWDGKGTASSNWIQIAKPSGFEFPATRGKMRMVQVFDFNETIKDQLYILEEGSTKILKWSGGALEVVGGSGGLDPAAGRDAVFWLSRLWVAGGVEDENGYIYFSKIGEPNRIDKSAGYLINPTDETMRIVPFMQNGLLVFQRNSIWILDIDQANFGDLTFDATSIMPINTDIGTVAPDSVVQAGHDFFFLSRHGVHRLAKTERDRPLGVTIPISDKIKGTMDRINWAYAYDCVGTVWDNLYMLAVPLDSATTNSHVLVYDMIENAWSIFSGWAPSAFLPARFTAEEALYYGDAVTGKLYEALESSADTDAGVDIDSIIETGRFSFGGTSFRKHFQYLDLYVYGGTGGSVELYVAKDEGDFSLAETYTITSGGLALGVVDDDNSGFVLDENAILSDGGLFRNRFYLDRFEACREMQFKFRSNGQYKVKILYFSVSALPEMENFD
jgi:hypothetical protein